MADKEEATDRVEEREQPGDNEETAETETPQETETEEAKDETVATTKAKTTEATDGNGYKDCKRIEDLGLGRGVDATKSHPWQNKSSFQVRTVKANNVIETEESGQKEYYEEEVSSVLTQQLNTKLTINEPSNSLVIGVDAEGSRSFSETRKSVGEKVMTRTVAFSRTYDETEESSSDDTESFEEELSKWIVDRILTKQRWKEEDEANKSNDQREETLAKKPEKSTYLDHLNGYIGKLKKRSDGLKLILQYCYDFIEHIGITHYVHTVKLGASKYKVLTTEEYYLKLEGTSGFELNRVAKVEMNTSAEAARRNVRTLTLINEIGIIDSGHKVQRIAPNEAVLEVELKPLHSLIKTRALQLATKWALERYTKRRESRREGPFLIACRDGDKPIYWRVMDSEVVGTTERKNASLFYVLQTDDSRHPNEFYIGYVGDNLKDLELPKGPSNPISKINKLAPTPKYVTAVLTRMGKCEGPLRVNAGAHRNYARFSLHNSVPRRYTAMRSPIDTDKWAEGGGYFINCARRLFKLDGYLAMEKDVGPPRARWRGNTTPLDTGNNVTPPISYRTTCYTSIKKHSSDGPWMVFRLLPGEHKELEMLAEERPQLLEDDITKLLADIGSNPTYLSDDRDFLYLFGDLSNATGAGDDKTTDKHKSKPVPQPSSSSEASTQPAPDGEIEELPAE